MTFFIGQILSRNIAGGSINGRKCHIGPSIVLSRLSVLTLGLWIVYIHCSILSGNRGLDTLHFKKIRTVMNVLLASLFCDSARAALELALHLHKVHLILRLLSLSPLL